MSMFMAGLALFFVLHFITATPGVRQRLVDVSGQNVWKGLVAVGSLAGVVLIAVGWSAAPQDVVFAPSALAIGWAPVLMPIALVLFVIGGGGFAGHIRRRLHHPMLIGVILWSGTHLLANGGVRDTWLFGAFLVYSIYALCSLLLAGKRASFVPAWKWDALGIGIGLIVAMGVMHGHRWLFGVAAY